MIYLLKRKKYVCNLVKKVDLQPKLNFFCDLFFLFIPHLLAAISYKVFSIFNFVVNYLGDFASIMASDTSSGSTPGLSIFFLW